MNLRKDLSELDTSLGHLRRGICPFARMYVSLQKAYDIRLVQRIIDFAMYYGDQECKRIISFVFRDKFDA